MAHGYIPYVGTYRWRIAIQPNTDCTTPLKLYSPRLGGCRDEVVQFRVENVFVSIEVAG